MSNEPTTPGLRNARRALDRIEDIAEASERSGVAEGVESGGSGELSRGGIPRKAWRKRVCVALAAAVLVVAIVWAGLQVAAFATRGADASAGSSQATVSVSDAARLAAERDAAAGSDVQRAHLDPRAFDQVTVRHVVDGDTIAVALADGGQASVRLIGVDSPESVAPQKERNCEEGVQASAHMESLIKGGDTLWLQYDTSETDKYGRLLAYAWLARPTGAGEADDPAFIAQHMLNAIQVLDGYAQPKRYRPDTYHGGLFAAWGDEAVADGRGVTSKWA